jgi:phosphate transport system ATP-binding protein
MLFRASQRFGSDRAGSPSQGVELAVGDLRLQNALLASGKLDSVRPVIAPAIPLVMAAPSVMSRSLPFGAAASGKTQDSAGAEPADYGTTATLPNQNEPDEHKPDQHEPDQHEPDQHEFIGGQAEPDELAAAGFIEAQDLSVRYGQTQALLGVSLSIARNRVAAIIGPSGSGMTSFLRAINRLNDLIPACKVSGRLTVGGVNIYQRGIDLVSLRRDVGLVFQKPNPFAKSIYDNVAFGPRLQGTRSRSDLDAIVEDALRNAGLWEEVKDRLRRSALRLPGDAQQRLCIARVLANRPKVLLMDEPTNGMDPLAAGKIEDVINRLRATCTIVLATHDLKQAARVSDDTAFFYMGRLVEYAATVTMFTAPRERLSEQYITGRFG